MKKAFIAVLAALVITGIYAVRASVELHQANNEIKECKQYIKTADSLMYQIIENNGLLDTDGSDTMQEFLEYTNQ